METFTVNHETEKGEILFVKVPDDSRDFELSKWNYQKQDYVDDLTLIFESKEQYNLKKGDRPHIQLNVKGFKLIGLTSEITEEQVKMILTKSGGPWSAYRDYTADNNWFASALWSFRSLMQHLQVYEVNPLDKPKEDKTVGMVSLIDFWNYVESRTGKWLVLFKPEI